MHIKPETLKALRTHHALSQDELANKSNVAKKTIGDIERGKRKANATTTKRLAKALNVEPADLAKDFEEIGLQKTDRGLGYRKISESIPADVHINFDMVEHLYGISRKSQIQMAPLLMALAAEASLNWRRKKLEKITEASNAIHGLAEGYLSFANAVYRINEGIMAEETSINNRDVFGKTAVETAFDLGCDPDTYNPFADYLRDFADQNSSQHISLDPDELWLNANGMPDYRIGTDIIENLTGGDKWARHALMHKIVRIQDIPKELMTKKKRDERVEWLAGKVSNQERKHVEDETNKILGPLGL